ncbi:hypothetical protein BJY52DRAFT_1199679 [Lactarius psammicola]|nr:hypothetical protein BJY52DRAFT_1199679 [Lactarius psammicola]
MAAHASFNFPSNIDPRLHTGASTYGGYSSDLSEVVANASEKMLEVNGHFLCTKMIAKQRATEIERLQEAIANQTRENGNLKVENRTLKEALHLFAKEYHDNKNTSDGGFLSISSEILPPKQALKLRTDNTALNYWVRREYTSMTRKQNRGETDGTATSVQVKRKRGHPPRESDDDEDHSAHFYLENQDGTPVDKSAVAEMSRKARMLWHTLDKNGLAPETFGKISKNAWDYFSRTMLADKAHEFLLLCDDGEWKLREWSMKSYPSWYRNKHLPPKTEKNSTDTDKDQTKCDEERRKQVLENPNLLQMEDDDPYTGEHHIEDSDDDPSEHTKANNDDPLERTKDNSAPDAGIESSDDDLDAEDPEQHNKDSNVDTNCSADDPAAWGTQNTPTLSEGPSADICTSATSALIDPFAPVPSTSISASTNATNMGATADSVLDPATHGATTTNGANPDHNNHNAGPSPVMTSSDSYLDQTKTKKRKADNNAPATANKKQKVDAMAVPTKNNSIRNICMCRWNKRQPGGQGLLSEFDIYFKSLTNAQKEPFKEEQCIAQVTARKAKLSAKKAKDVPNTN